MLKRAFIVQGTAILTVWLGMYYHGAEFVFSALYVYIFIREGRDALICCTKRSRVVLTALAWQAPGFLFSLPVFVPAWKSYKAVSFILLEIWHTPVIPWLSLCRGLIGGRPLYCYLICFLSPFLMVLYCISAWIPSKNKSTGFMYIKSV